MQWCQHFHLIYLAAELFSHWARHWSSWAAQWQSGKFSWTSTGEKNLKILLSDFHQFYSKASDSRMVNYKFQYRCLQFLWAHRSPVIKNASNVAVQLLHNSDFSGDIWTLHRSRSEKLQCPGWGTNGKSGFFLRSICMLCTLFFFLSNINAGEEGRG